jgi:hypothetical protein
MGDSEMSKRISSNRVVLMGVLGGILALTLSACAGPNGLGAASPASAAAPPSATSSTPATDAASEPTGTPTHDPASDPTAVVVHFDRLEIVDATGVVRGSAGYFEPVANAVSILAAATGVQPVVGRNVPKLEGYASTTYQRDGLTLYDLDIPVSAPLDTDWTVFVVGPSAGSLAVTTAGGIRVGQSQATVEAIAPGVFEARTVVDLPVLDGIFEETTVSTGETGNPLTHAVGVRLENTPATVTSIGAPGRNYGI